MKEVNKQNVQKVELNEHCEVVKRRKELINKTKLFQ